jgi:hypothetical protein
VHIEAPSAGIGYSRPAHSDATSLRYALELASSEGYQAFAPQAGTIFNITSGFAAILNGLLRTLYIGGLILGLFSLLQWLRTHARSGDGVHLYLLLIFLIPVLALTRHSVPVYPYYFVTTFPLPYLYPAITCHRLWKASAVLQYVGLLRSSLALMVMAIITLDAIAALAFFRAIKGFWPESPYGMPYAMTQRLVQQTVAFAQHSGIATIILPEHTQAGNILASELRRDHLRVITIDDRTTFLFPQQPALYFSFGNGFSQQFLQQHCGKDLLYQTTLPGAGVLVQWYLPVQHERDALRDLLPGAGVLVQWYLSSPPLTLHPPRENPILLHLL